MTFQPVTDLLVFVRRIVIHDKMNAEVPSDFGVEFLQEFKPLIVPMAWRHLAYDLATEVIECGKKGHRSMSIVIVSDRADMALGQGQSGLASLQSLALAFFITAEYHRIVRRVEINPDHVPELGFELLVARQFEYPRPVRLNVVDGPDTLNGGL